ncbi:Probable carboxylesterase LipT [Mycobacteroides abscessus subsp. abscessus]|uniref:carboxylesterase/lipase family protein n=1 Tax=Mycobacteroides abscessus TaxID=36809 RepID=UPI00092B5CF0|nr:carboxylesterase/lipase family protein [Mycobacteroides abscessus]SIK86075.1 Probable carboxylesterase LipT [Mycobacteroides abscessus subsp. abscessus]SLC91027.1 Probable carboxylesterase LipT [Mycobacteroides abscessus subsp. abscessus]
MDSGSKTPTVRVTTPNGIVEGFVRGGVRRFRSIPYARPPIGLLRLRAPQPALPWEGVRDCTEFGAAAPQRRRYRVLGPGRVQRASEDCLTVNVVTPDRPSNEPLPVMFFIYGGGYLLGSSATPLYDGAALARRGCVYVSVNYRVGALGALDLSSLSDRDHTIDGNLFLRDVVLALQWVHDNIGTFGGDPGNVTIFGESAGAHCVETLMATPAAAGLFHRAICQSTASGMAVPADSAAMYAQKFAQILSATTQSAAETVLRSTPAELGAALNMLIADIVTNMPGGSFAIGPCIDGHYLPRHPIEAMEHGEAHRVPLIVGHNADEAKLFTRVLKMMPLSESALEGMLTRGGPGHRDRIVAAYPGYPERSARVKLAGDMNFSTAAWQMAEAHHRYAPVYFYRYDYAPGALRIAGMGATHATELLAVFDSYRGAMGTVMAGALGRRDAVRVSNDVQRRWLAFARSGVPGDGWPTYGPPDRAVMVFDHATRVELDPEAARRAAWEGFSLAL